MRWIPRDGKLPPKGGRILVFSPIHSEGDSLRFRILDSEFFSIATDATHWALLEPPKAGALAEAEQDPAPCDHCDCWTDHRDVCCDCGACE